METGSTNFITGDFKEYMRIKHKRQLLEYQIRFFSKEIRKEEKRLAKLIEGQEMRREVYKLKYDSIDDLNGAYLLELIDDKEYMRQRSALWQVYSDRGANQRIEWLTKEKEKYELEQEALNEYLATRRSDRMRRKTQQKRRHNKRGFYFKTLERMDEETRLHEQAKLDRRRAKKQARRATRKKERIRELKEREKRL